MKNKLSFTIIKLLLIVVAVPCFGQKTSTLTRKIDDNGTTLELYIDMKSSDKNVYYKRDFDIKGMSKLQKDSLIKYVLDSLGVSNEATEPLNQTAPADIKSAIQKLNNEMEAAFNANDMMKVASFYADDAEISADDYSVKGRSKIDKYWMDLKDKGRGWKLDVVEIGGRGEFVYQLGRSDLNHLSGADNKPAKSVTNFVLIWRLQPDGYYKIFKDYLTRTQFSK